MPVALLPFRQPSSFSGEPDTLVGPSSQSPASTFFSGEQHRDPTVYLCNHPDFSLARHPACAGWLTGEWPVQSTWLTHGVHPDRASPAKGELKRHRASQSVGFKALIRRRIRTRHMGVTPRPGRCSPDLSPSGVCQLDRWACALPSSTFDTGVITLR